MRRPVRRSPVHFRCVIRAPVARDFGRMAELAGQLGYPCDASQIRARLSEMHDSSQYSVFVAELSQGQIAGWIGAHIFRALELDKGAEISGLIVDREVRSRGIGKALLNAVEEWARKDGLTAISVRSNVKRERAHGFYKKNGYKWTKTQETFRKSL